MLMELGPLFGARAFEVLALIDVPAAFHQPPARAGKFAPQAIRQ
jgi:hypothetical protein